MIGNYACTNCGNTEYKERGVICWKCGKGEMVYTYLAYSEETKQYARELKCAREKKEEKS